MTTLFHKSSGVLLVALLLAGRAAGNGPARGPLKVSEANPRYFTDGSGEAVYLTGAHTWNNLQDMGPTNPPPQFDFERYLDFLESHHHNFIRLWRWELLRWNTAANREEKARVHFAAPHPWARPGPGQALDGGAKFDLDRFDEQYFQRLRSRVAAAGERGIYVSIMLFEGWGIQFMPDAWKAHPFNPANNVRGLDGDANGDGKGLEIFTLETPAVTAFQEAYVRKVIDTVGDLDNVLYEISNENHPASTQWQYHMIRFIRDYEKKKPKQHPIGMTFQYRGGTNAALFASPADWISPNPQADGGYNFRDNPPPADGSKVVLTDTDHLWGIGGDRDWVWKSFLRGLNPLFMDPYDNRVLSRGPETQWEPVRRALGETRRFAERMDLLAMKPQPASASTGYCLSHPGVEYLVYQPKGAFEVMLAGGTYVVEWYDPSNGKATAGGELTVKSGKRPFDPPFEGPAVLYLKAKR